MRIRVMDVDINYIRYGNPEGQSLVLLHGWGQNIQMMKPLGDRLKNFDVVIFDLPGFGSTSEPPKFWSCYDYVDALHEALSSMGIDNPVIVGHSFGGKLGLIYASKYQVSKLVCLASPFCREIHNITMKTKILKFMKKVPIINRLEDFAKKHIGSTDYRNASGIMRNILVDHVNLDITDDVRLIKCPTLLIWGTNDEAVSIERGYELERLIKDAGIVVFDGCTHYAYLERLGQTVRVLKNFLGVDKDEN